jgi:hypothetical protein
MIIGETGEETLWDEEISILNGVMELSTKNVESIMTRMKARSTSFPKGNLSV